MLTLPEIPECLNFKIYIEALDDLRMNRKIARDSNENLRLKAIVNKKWQDNVMPTHNEQVGHGAAVADLVARLLACLEKN